MYHGIINIYKEAGYTSFDVVAKLRGILHQKKIGHTGTLDPDAEGVLPVCLGNGTKLVEDLTEKTKVYECVMKLGVETDTEDMSGSVLSSKPVTSSEGEIREACLSFIGDYDQIPPMYSAIKVNGRKLYELARNGEEIERKARAVRIIDLEGGPACTDADRSAGIERWVTAIEPFCGKEFAFGDELLVLNSLQENLINYYEKQGNREDMKRLLEQQVYGADALAVLSGIGEDVSAELFGHPYCTHNAMALLRLYEETGEDAKANQLKQGCVIYMPKGSAFERLNNIPY